MRYGRDSRRKTKRIPNSLLIASIARPQGSSIPPPTSPEGRSDSRGAAGGLGATAIDGGGAGEGRRRRKSPTAATSPAAMPPEIWSASPRENRKTGYGRASGRGTVRTAVQPAQRRRLPAAMPVTLNLLPQNGQRTRRRDMQNRPPGPHRQPPASTRPHASRRRAHPAPLAHEKSSTMAEAEQIKMPGPRLRRGSPQSPVPSPRSASPVLAPLGGCGGMDREPGTEDWTSEIGRGAAPLSALKAPKYFLTVVIAPGNSLLRIPGPAGARRPATRRHASAPRNGMKTLSAISTARLRPICPVPSGSSHAAIPSSVSRASSPRASPSSPAAARKRAIPASRRHGWFAGRTFRSRHRARGNDSAA